MNALNPDKCYDIVTILYREVMEQENEVIRQKLLQFRSEDVNWVLNHLQETFNTLEDVLDLQSKNYQV